MKEYSNYVFDLYGTLVDIRTDEDRKFVWKKMALYYSLQGAEYTAKELRKAYVTAVSELEVAPDERGVSPAEEIGGVENAGIEENPAVKGSGIGADCREDREIQLCRVWERLYADKGVSVKGGKAEETGVFFRALSLEKLKLYPGALKLLKRLKKDGKRVFLLSNAQRMYTEPEMRLLGIYHLFDGILYSSDTGWKKPSDKFYGMLFQRFGLRKEESVMVGNDYIADASGASRFGIHSIYIHTKQSSECKGSLPEDCRRIKKIGEVY